MWQSQYKTNIIPSHVSSSLISRLSPHDGKLGVAWDEAMFQVHHQVHGAVSLNFH